MNYNNLLEYLNHKIKVYRRASAAAKNLGIETIFNGTDKDSVPIGVTRFTGSVVSSLKLALSVTDLERSFTGASRQKSKVLRIDLHPVSLSCFP